MINKYSVDFINIHNMDNLGNGIGFSGGRYGCVVFAKNMREAEQNVLKKYSYLAGWHIKINRLTDRGTVDRGSDIFDVLSDERSKVLEIKK